MKNLGIGSLLLVLLGSACVVGTGEPDPGEEGLGQSEQELQSPESQPNDLPSNADPLKASDTGFGDIGVNSDVDMWLGLGQPGDLLFALADGNQSTASTDPFLTVFEDDGTTTIASDDASGPLSSSAVSGAAITGDGAFFELIEDGQDALITPYELFHAIVDPGDVETTEFSNDTIGTASSITRVRHDVSLGLTSDIDHFKIPARAGDSIVVLIDDDPDGDNTLTDTEAVILDVDGTTVIANDDGNSGNQANAVGPVFATNTGVHYLRVSDGGVSPIGDYAFVALVNGQPIVSPDPKIDDLLNAAIGDSDALPELHRAEGDIEFTGDIDHFHGVGNTGDIIYAHFAVPSGDALMDVLDDTGSLIESDDNDGPGSSSVVAGAIASGRNTYFRVREDGDDATFSNFELFKAIVDPTDSATEGTDNNDSIPEAQWMTAQEQMGTAPSGDVDYYSFVARAGDRVSVIMDDDPDDDNSLFDSTLTLNDATDAVLATADDVSTNDANATVPVTIPADGRYYVRIANGGGGADDDYAFVVTNAFLPEAYCGNGVQEGNEACDDGNDDPNDDCLNDCTTPTCGDGIVWNGGTGTETCDDGNNVDNDDCTNACAMATCGDSIVWNQGSGTETCDDGNNVDNDDCTNACAMATCGDNIVWNQGSGTEECDDANANNNDDCIDDCSNAICGDGNLHNEGTGTETCDDGNTTPGDGCDDMCLEEGMGGAGGMGTGGMGTGGSTTGTGGMGTGGDATGGSTTGPGTGGGTTGTGASSASGGSEGDDTEADGGCGCHVVGGQEAPNDDAPAALAGLLALGLLRRRRRD
jgi:MYXO-CTERM domain-containing protein